MAMGSFPFPPPPPPTHMHTSVKLQKGPFSNLEKAALRDAVHKCAEVRGFSCDEGYGWLTGCEDRTKKGERLSAIAGALPHRTRESVRVHLDLYYSAVADKEVCGFFS